MFKSLFNILLLLISVSFLQACGGGSPVAYGSGTTAKITPQPPPQPPSLDTIPMPADAIMVKNAAELTTALNNSVGGETIALASGTYGNFTVSNKTYNSTVFVRPQIGAAPVFTQFNVSSCSHMQIGGLSILPRITNGAYTVAVDLSGDNIIFESALVDYADSTAGWSAQDWVNKTSDGIRLSGDTMIVRDNLIYNIANGIVSLATNSLISRNKINGYRADGIDGLGNYTTFQYNDIRNCFHVDGTHADGFQAWTTGPGGVGTGTVVGVKVIGNTVIESDNLSNPLRCQLQGISNFDGFSVDWLVANNLVVVSGYHGITFAGANNVNIINNTVISSDPIGGQIPWIMIDNHKNGTPSTNSLIRNNISSRAVYSGAGSSADHNLTVSTAQLSTTFVDSTNLNFKLIAGSLAIDAGTTVMAPALDILGNTRAAPIDLGAYEFQ